MATKNLGQIAGLISKNTAPSNTKLIWRDTSVNPAVFKFWNGSQWVEIGGAKLEKEINSSIDLGGYSAGDALIEGTSFTDFVETLLTVLFEPTFVAPSFSLTATGNSLRVIGASTTFDLIFNFDRGEILGDIVGGVWDANAVQNPRAGAADDYTIDGVLQDSNTLNRTLTVAQGLNTFNGVVNYLEGAQPLDSNGDNFGSPLPAGQSPQQTDSFEGVYPLFATTSNITTPTQQPLYSMLNANNIEITLVAESGGNKQFFEIPDAWLAGRPLVEVEFFNTVSNQFDDTNQISTFTTSAEINSIEGNSVNYTRYTNNLADRGELKIRLIF